MNFSIIARRKNDNIFSFTWSLSHCQVIYYFNSRFKKRKKGTAIETLIFHQCDWIKIHNIRYIGYTISVNIPKFYG
ncbi:hypothetical protein GCM10023142_24040 [Anaerocolumna aminovalerica]